MCLIHFDTTQYIATIIFTELKVFHLSQGNFVILGSERLLVAVVIIPEGFIECPLLEIHNGHLECIVYLSIAHRLKSI